MKKALIAMSGGVDSSVAAFLTKEKGFDVAGVTMKMFGNELIGVSGESTCCSTSDVEDAAAVCRKLGIPFHVFNFADEFDKEVVQRFVRAYEEGRTPNPCVDCNRYLKFGALFRRMRELGYDYIVTGHYAGIEKAGEPGSHTVVAGVEQCGAADSHTVVAGVDVPAGRYLLKKATDPKKDQSYFLYSLTQEQLAHVMFPLNDMDKSETRKIAEEQGFINARKHDSQDICFVPDGDHAGFIERYTGKEYPHGDFVDEHGTVLGEHKGLIRYTVGQRKGLGLALPAPLYVCRKDTEKNQVVLAPDDHLFSKTLTVYDFNWIAFDESDVLNGGGSAGDTENTGNAADDAVNKRCISDDAGNAENTAGDKEDKGNAAPAIPGTFHGAVKVRYSQKESPATITPLGSGRVRIDFDEPVRAITSGQAAVVYDGDIVIGGGTIE